MYLFSWRLFLSKRGRLFDTLFPSFSFHKGGTFNSLFPSFSFHKVPHFNCFLYQPSSYTSTTSFIFFPERLFDSHSFHFLFMNFFIFALLIILLLQHVQFSSWRLPFLSLRRRLFDSLFPSFSSIEVLHFNFFLLHSSFKSTFPFHFLNFSSEIAGLHFI